MSAIRQQTKGKYKNNSGSTPTVNPYILSSIGGTINMDKEFNNAMAPNTWPVFFPVFL